MQPSSIEKIRSWDGKSKESLEDLFEREAGSSGFLDTVVDLSEN